MNHIITTTNKDNIKVQTLSNTEISQTINEEEMEMYSNNLLKELTRIMSK